MSFLGHFRAISWPKFRFLAYILETVPLRQKLKKSECIFCSILVSGRYPPHQNVIFGPFCAILGHLGPFMVILGHFFAILGHFLAILCHFRSWTILVHFGPFWDIWDHIWATLGHLESFFTSASILPALSRPALSVSSNPLKGAAGHILVFSPTGQPCKDHLILTDSPCREFCYNF